MSGVTTVRHVRYIFYFIYGYQGDVPFSIEGEKGSLSRFGALVWPASQYDRTILDHQPGGKEEKTDNNYGSYCTHMTWIYWQRQNIRYSLQEGSQSKCNLNRSHGM